jgi:uncharacterized protein YggE
MERTVTIRGTGHFKGAPDAVCVSFSIVSRNSEYAEAMKLSASRQKKLIKALGQANFKAKDLKTTDFSVRTETKELDRYGVKKYVFDCYAITQKFKLSFDIDHKRLGVVLKAISESTADPNLSISFYIKDENIVRDALFASAAENARKSAEVLCKSSGAKLGDLITISYDWSELDIYSGGRYSPDAFACSEAPGIHPDDVHVSESVRFVWKIA